MDYRRMRTVKRRTFLQMPLPALSHRGPAIIAHRAAHERDPENSLAAVRAGIQLGVDYVELDVRTAAGGSLVLKHDALTPADQDVPLFDEALALLRASGTGLYLDWKAAAPEAVAGALRRHDMLARTVIYASPDKLRALRRVEPRARIMPEAVSAKTLRQTLEELRPGVVAFDRNDFHDDVIQVARAAGAGIFVDRLGPDDNEAAWRDAIRRGATGIQTDRPGALLTLLRDLNRG